GTLADTEREGHRVAFNEAFAEAGLDWFWDEALYGLLLKVTGGKQRMHHYLREFYDGLIPESVDQLIVDLHARKNYFYQRLLAEGRIPLRPGVKRLMLEAKEQGVTLAIATTTTPGNVSALLEATLGKESLDWFAVIAAGDMVPALKPAPDVYLYTLDQLGFSARECVAVEDSFNGLQSALSAGLPTLVTTNAYTRSDDFSGAALTVDGLGEPGAVCGLLSGSLAGESMITMNVLRTLVD
ncbi:unnamed protein product, partial [Cyprideis torosa]